MKTDFIFINGKWCEWCDFGGVGDTVIIAHANGFPVQIYRSVAALLERNYHIIGLNYPGHGLSETPDKVSSWYNFAELLVSFIKTKNLSRIHGLGHSLGAITLIIAQTIEPKLFRDVILIEPVLFNPMFLKLAGLLHAVGITSARSPSKIAMKRTELFQSREEMKDSFESKKVFAGFKPETLADYINYGTFINSENKAQLLCSKITESQIYDSVYPNTWERLRCLRVPSLFIRAKNSNTFSSNCAKLAKAVTPKTSLIELEGSHLIPMENPVLIAKLSHEFFEKNSKI